MIASNHHASSAVVTEIVNRDVHDIREVLETVLSG